MHNVFPDPVSAPMFRRLGRGALVFGRLVGVGVG